jgi:Holliday junction resolvasome RuvABC DNA-binding subunit
LRRCPLHRDHGDDHVRDRVYDDEFVIVDEAQVTAKFRLNEHDVLRNHEEVEPPWNSHAYIDIEVHIAYPKPRYEPAVKDHVLYPRPLLSGERNTALRTSLREPARTADLVPTLLRVKARGHRELVTLVGHAAAISAGEWITASGNWVNDRTHGQQFKVRFLKTSAPTSVEGIEKYLASGVIRGIGPVYAKKLLRAFGEKVFDVIEAEPDRLREVDGIGPVRAGRITAAWAEQKAVREIMVFLHSHGVGTARAVRIYKTYGGDAVQVMWENPYRLARDIRGIGFKTADAIAMKLGIDKAALVRVRAGMDEGHCGLPTDELVPLAGKLLEVPQELIRTALDLELAEGAIVPDECRRLNAAFSWHGLYRAERGIAGRLRQLGVGKVPWPSIDPEKAIPWIEQRTGLVSTLIHQRRLTLSCGGHAPTAERIVGSGEGDSGELDTRIRN